MKGWLPGLLRVALKAVTNNPGHSLAWALMMLAQDVLLFATWVVFFRAVGPVKGWTLADTSLLYGLLFISFGAGLFFTSDGFRTAGRAIGAREIDHLLVRPLHPLPQLMIQRYHPMNGGDIVAGFLLLAVSGLSPWQWVMALVAAVAIALILMAGFVTFQSLAFFVKNGNRLGENLTDAVYYLTTVPQHAEPLAVKLVLFTVLPAGFMNFFPVEMIRRVSLAQLGILVLAAMLYCGIAWWVFNRGLRRYKS